MHIHVDIVINLYKSQIAKNHGSYVLLNRGTLESALASPYVSFAGIEKYPTDVEKIAVLIFKVGKAHAFSDGNKRIAWLIGMIWANNHGYTLDVEQVEAYNQVNDLMTKKDIPNSFITWINDNLSYKS